MVERVKNAIDNFFYAPVNYKDKMRHDLKIDTLDQNELRQFIELELNVKIPQEEWDTDLFSSVKDPTVVNVVNFVQKKLEIVKG